MTGHGRGHRAYQTRIAQFGPDEQKRARQKQKWTRDNKSQPPSENPYSQEKVYPSEELARAERFGRWNEANPDRSHRENPFVHPGALPMLDDNGVPPNEDAIDDLDPGSPADRAKTIGYRYKRDPAVRKKVKTRASGVCEYCGRPGFLDVDGQPYLECHHIITLAKQGRDKPWNVIALCPEHHREAHFGQLAEQLEKTMAIMVKRKEGVR
jgi:HNH endonuclease